MGIFSGFIDSIKNDNFKGWKGETLTEFELVFLKLLGKNGKILRNIYIPKKNSTTSEIDVMYITQKGIFVLESKNYSGCISGKEEEQNWTASYPDGNKYELYNPIKQNATHIKYLKNYLLPLDIPVFSIIVFSDNCTFKELKISDNTPVIHKNQLSKTIKNMWSRNPDVIDKNIISQISTKLKPLTKVSSEVKKEHIENIISNNEKYNREENRRYKCPECGAFLILRTSKKGDSFYGCANFPECRYTKNIDK